MEWVPVADALPGVLLAPPREGHTILEAVVVAKQLDAEGRESWSVRWTNGLGSVERLGALQMAVADAERDLVRWLNSDEDD